MKYVLFFLFIIFLISGCGKGVDDQLRSTVLFYNAKLIEVYQTGNLNELEEITTKEQSDILGARIKGFEQIRVRYAATLHHLEFSGISIASPEIAEVATIEVWELLHNNIQSGRDVSRMTVQYSCRYILHKELGKWLVAGVQQRPVTEKEREGNTSLPGLTRDPDPSRFDDSPDEVSMITVVDNYLTLLADGYRSQDMTKLTRYATQRRAMKAYYHMSSLGEGRVRMDPRLIGINVISLLHPSEDLTQVLTEESWAYTYYSTQTGQKVFANDARYTVKYSLVPEKGKYWFVDDITVLSSDEGEAEGVLPFVQRPSGHPLGQ